MRTVAAASLALALGACNNIPFASEPLPLEFAAHKLPLPLIEQTTRIAPAEGTAQPVRIGETTWVPTATEFALSDAQVRPVGDAAGATVYALAWDDAPFGRLLVPAGNGKYREMLPVYQAVPEAAEAGHGGMEHGDMRPMEHGDMRHDAPAEGAPEGH